jgi:cytochrome c oxidase subunit II
VLLAAGGCGSRFGAPAPASGQGAEVLDLWRMLMWTGIGVGGVVVVLLTITVVRDRRRRSQPPGLPPQTRENIPLEITYTAVPLVIVAVLFAVTMGVQRPVTRLSANPGLRVEATAFQWGWRFAYPAQDVAVLGDSNRPPTLVLPLGVVTRLVLESPDVVHSFYVPAFLDKRDVVPGTANELDVTPTRTGRFGGYCAEFCGLDHARMTFDVEVVEEPMFQRWLAERQRERQEQQGDSGTGPDGSADPSGQALGGRRPGAEAGETP